MFGSSKKQSISPEAGTASNQPADIADSSKSRGPVDIYTLPEKFLPNHTGSSGGSHKKSSGVSWLLVILLVLVVAGGVGAFFYFRQQKSEPTDELNTNVDIPDVPEQPVDEPEPEPVVTAPDPVQAVVLDPNGNTMATISIQLGVQDRAKAPEIQIAVSQGVEDAKVYGAIYRLTPSGLSLDDNALITIKYTDAKLKSSEENSLRIGYEQMLGSWQVEQTSEVDVVENVVSLTIRQIPRTRIALVSNLSNVTFDEPKNVDVVNPVDTTPVLEMIRLKTSLDSDFDGLTDVEEQLYTTASNLPDSDQDGYIDGQELINMYSPAQPVQPLEGSELVSRFTNERYGYSLLYPSGWTAQSVDGAGAVVLFSSPTSQFIQVVIQERESDLLSIIDWYKQQVPGVEDSLIEQLTVGEQAIPAIMSLDGTSVYFIYNDYIVTFSYNLGIEQEADYLQTWKMMQRSWKLYTGDVSDEVIVP